MEALSELQKEMIAGLNANPGFLLLLRTLEQGIGVIEEEMLKTTTQEESAWSFQYWKAMKRISKFLRTGPENYEKELEEALKLRLEAMGGVDFPDVRLLQPDLFPFR